MNTAEKLAEIGNDDSARSLQLLRTDLLPIVKRGGLVALGDAYMQGEWSLNRGETLDGIIEGFVRSGLLHKFSLRRLRYLLSALLLNPQKGVGAFVVGKRHYDLGNDLFNAMLDSTMTYTCGYWNKAATLQQAQEGKLRLACDKLHLRPGMRVLDIGCGWGNFAHYAAKHYGVSVVGVTVSKEQAAFATERCRNLPVEIRLQDYREVQESFDRVVSIEMIEAVGKKNMPTFFEVVRRSLNETGLFLLQVISCETFSRNSHPAIDDYVVWLLKHIFPNGYLPNMREITSPSNGLIVEDMHNFPLDYEKTLAAWESNFEREWPTLSARYDERFKRMWNFYLGGCQVFFRTRIVQLYQVVYSKGELPSGYQVLR